MKTTKKIVFLFAGLMCASIHICGQMEGEVAPAPAEELLEALQVQAQPASASPQENAKKIHHEFSIWASGGYSSLYYKPTVGTRNPFGFGGSAGLSYTLFFNKNWGLLLGGELMCYTAHYRQGLDALNNTYRTTYDDWSGNTEKELQYFSKYENYKEQQTLVNLNIPLLLQFQTATWSDHKFYAALGFKFGLPLNALSFYRVEEASRLTSWGYLPEYDMYYYAQDYLGCGSYLGDQKKEKIEDAGGKSLFDFSYTASAELGLKWRLSGRLNLYTGIYFDYTFSNVEKAGKGWTNDILKGNHAAELLEFNRLHPEAFITNSILTASYTQDDERIQVIDKAFPLSFGLKLRLGIDLGKEKEKTQAQQRREAKKAEQEAKEAAKEAREEAREAARAQAARDANGAVQRIIIEHLYPGDGDDGNGDGSSRGRGRRLRESDREDVNRLYNEHGDNLIDVMTVYMDGYNLDQSKLSSKMKNILNVRARELRKYDTDAYRIICEGHTCDIGTHEYNEQLGQKRADIVREYLIRQGFNPAHISAVSKGQDFPIVPNSDEENRKTNRRVVFLVREK